MKPLVSYIRVSTSQQGRSGLGIQAQREALERFADAEGFEIVAEFVEVETGKGSDALDCESAPNFDPQPFHCKHLKDKRIDVIMRGQNWTPIKFSENCKFRCCFNWLWLSWGGVKAGKDVLPGRRSA